MSRASIEAYLSSLPRMPERRRKVLDAIHGWELGRTCGEIALSLGWPRDSVSPRMAELKRAGLVIDSGRIFNGQTVYCAVDDPALCLRLAKAKKVRSAQYRRALADAAKVVEQWLSGELSADKSEIKALILGVGA